MVDQWLERQEQVLSGTPLLFPVPKGLLTPVNCADLHKYMYLFYYWVGLRLDSGVKERLLNTVFLWKKDCE